MPGTGSIPKQFIPPVEKGFRDSLLKGPLAEFPVVGVKMELMDGSYHDVDSSERAFYIAACDCFRETMRAANPVLLEPIMKCDIECPENDQGPVVGDIISRRGLVTQTDARNRVSYISAEVPLANTFGYATDLRSMTKGQGTFSMDMWSPFMEATRAACPDAAIVHDKSHVSKYLGEAVDKVRRQENTQLIEEGDDRLKGTRQLWLYAMENLPEDKSALMLSLRQVDLKTGRAWSMKENFRYFWECGSVEEAKVFFTTWHSWATRSKLPPIAKVAAMLKRHLSGLLSYVTHRITNAASEGFNSKIQSIKSAARGFSSFEKYRTRILFVGGKLDLFPSISTH